MSVNGLQRPLVSVVIPAYNSAAFVADAISSALSQTYQPVECVVVDDGSDDGTADEVARFTDRVRYLSQQNEGVSSARNRGVAAANGQYVSFLDADDLWLPQKIELQMKLFRQQPHLAAVYTGLHLIDTAGDFRGREEPPAGVAAFRNTLLLERPIMSIVTAVLPKIVLERVGGFDEGLSTSADCDLGCRIAMRYPVEAVPRPLVLYRRHADQMHANPETTERDMRLVFERFFADEEVPHDIRRLKNRAYANLFVSLAGAYLMRGNRRKFLEFAARALIRRPDRVLAAVGRLASPGGGVSRAV